MADESPATHLHYPGTRPPHGPDSPRGFAAKAYTSDIQGSAEGNRHGKLADMNHFESAQHFGQALCLLQGTTSKRAMAKVLGWSAAAASDWGKRRDGCHHQQTDLHSCSAKTTASEQAPEAPPDGVQWLSRDSTSRTRSTGTS